MTIVEFTTVIKANSPAWIVTNHVLERIPHVFGNDWVPYRSWRRELAVRLGVDQCNIVITGSACTGFSLNPHKSLKPFDANSDVDVAIVSDHHFTLGWRKLREVRPFTLTDRRKRQALREHQTRYIYWGCIATDRILQLMPFASSWVIGRNDMSSIHPTSGRNINFRVYRDFQSLRSYLEFGVKSTQEKLLSKEL